MGALLSIISFLTSPVGRWVGIAALIAGAYGLGYYKGDAHGDKQCADARLRMTIARQKVEISVVKDQAASANATAAELEKQASAAEETIRELREKLKAKPETVFVDGCLVPGGVRDKPRPKR